MHIELSSGTGPNPHLEIERRWALGIPDVRLSQDKQWLIWELPEPEAFRPHPGMSGALEAVVSIVRGDDEPLSKVAVRVLGVARRHGPLYLCWHGSPMNHDESCLLATQFKEKGSERIYDWSMFARQVRDLISFASALSSASKFEDVKDHPLGQQVDHFSGGLIEERTLTGVVVGPGPLSDRSKGHAIPVTLSDATFWIEQRLDELIELGKLRPAVQWSESKNKFEFGFEPGKLGLYGNAVLQSALMIGGAARWLKCDSCQIVYFRKPGRKMPGPSQFNFCDECDRPDVKRMVQRQRKRRVSDG